MAEAIDSIHTSDDKPLGDYAQEYARQIVVARDDETRIQLLREFAAKAYAKGWKAATDSVRAYLDSGGDRRALQCIGSSPCQARQTIGLGGGSSSRMSRRGFSLVTPALANTARRSNARSTTPAI